MYGELLKVETSAGRLTNMEGEAPATKDLTEKRIEKWRQGCINCSQAPALIDHEVSPDR